MAVSPGLMLFRLIGETTDFGAAELAHHTGRHLRAVNRGASKAHGAVPAEREHIGQVDRGAGLGFNLLHLQPLVLFHSVLSATRSYDRIHNGKIPKVKDGGSEKVEDRTDRPSLGREPGSPA